MGKKSNGQMFKLLMNYEEKSVLEFFGFLRFVLIKDTYVLNKFQEISKDNFFDPTRTPPFNVENEALMWVKIQKICGEIINQYSTTYDEDMKILEDQKLTVNQRNCVILRIGEKQYQNIIKLFSYMQQESILNLIPNDMIKPQKKYRYISKYPPNIVPTSSTIGLKGLSKPFVKNIGGYYNDILDTHLMLFQHSKLNKPLDKGPPKKIQKIQTTKKNGEIPNYLIKIKQQILQNSIQKQEAEQNNKFYQLSDEEIQQLKIGLQINYDKINYQYQQITHIRNYDNQYLKRKKETCEQQLKQIEQDLAKLQNNKIMVDCAK
ncbi:SET domain protein [Ichthyophthirius multifiliis]|uniref:SET domain protein n=1 Tax=Ichthyophthirius multifiliis TaxID=5932 RepID=G0QYL3_ICHMU|nr:SET domain protein [Ichthyophthirius multifiliis]EGR29687.1 SET domain protein [Ichthyophthirius multifiliis]|eukprot:XP_004030923.1 SET domain protein [Ichthyophthirius multifiliis]